MHELGPRFERATGYTLAIASTTLGAIVKRVQDGERCDVVLGPRTAMDGFVQDGRAFADSLTVVARSLMSVAVREGAPKPDISSLAAFRRALLAARSIAYPDPGNPLSNVALGIHFAQVIDRLGITGEMKPRTVFSRTADIGELVANGDAEIGISQRQSLMRFAGIHIIGALPADLQYEVAFAAVILDCASDYAASKALVEFLRTPDAAVAIRAAGMEPVSPGKVIRDAGIGVQ